MPPGVPETTATVFAFMRSPSAASLIGAAGAAGAGARDEPRAFTPAAFWAGASAGCAQQCSDQCQAEKNERRITAIPRWPRHAGAQHACPCEDHPRAINDRIMAISGN